MSPVALPCCLRSTHNNILRSLVIEHMEVLIFTLAWLIGLALYYVTRRRGRP